MKGVQWIERQQDRDKRKQRQKMEKQTDRKDIKEDKTVHQRTK